MKRNIYENIFLISILINIYNSYEIKNNSNVESTILLEIKTFKYTEDSNFNYYISFNPHANYNLSAKDPKFFNIDLILNNIYTDISIGNPEHKILGFFSGKLNNFKIFYYNYSYNESETFNFLSQENETFPRCSENFRFKCNNEIYKLNDVEFIKTKYSNLKLSHSFLGLQISSKDIESIKRFNRSNTHNIITNFVESLQKSHCQTLNISNYYWTIKYFEPKKDASNNSIDGIFYFGEPPHVYDPINYKKEDFREINTEAGYDNLYWGMKFDNIDFINKTTKETIYEGKYNSIEYSLIYPELNFFITSENFFGRIKKVFFNKFVNKRKSPNYNSSICFEKFVSIVDDISLISQGNYNDLKGIYDIFYCNKTRIMEYGEEKFYNEFPIIKFHHLLLGYNFEFNSNDLFFEKDGDIYFSMTLKITQGDKWIFGKTFMKKYQIVFNNDMRTLGFYLPKEKNVIKPKEIIIYDNNESNSNILWIIIIISVVILFVIIFLIYYCIKNNICRNKRNAEELDEFINNANEIN